MYEKHSEGDSFSGSNTLPHYPVPRLTAYGRVRGYPLTTRHVLPREYYGHVYVGVRFKTTRPADKYSLRLTVFLRGITAARAFLACVCRVYGQHFPTTPALLIFELATHFLPALIKYRLVKT